jgi:hypothetical protein
MGNPDLIVLFTNPVAHEMIKIAKKKAVAGSIPLVQSHCASCSSLRNVLAQAKLATAEKSSRNAVTAEVKSRKRGKRI